MNDLSYKEWTSMTDKALIETIGKFIQHHRLNQNRSQQDVAHDAGISRSTLSLLERGEKVALISLIQVLRVLDLLYIMDIFSVKKEISPIAYAKLIKNQRQRASTMSNEPNVNDELGW